MIHQQPLLITTKELCALFGVDRTRLWTWQKKFPDFPKRFPAPRSQTFLRAETEKWLEKRSQHMTTPQTTQHPFIALVADMRQAQRDYFTTRTSGDLKRAKALEAKVDKALDNYINGPRPQPPTQGSLV